MRSARLSYTCNQPQSAFSIVDGKEFCSQCQTSIVDFTVMTDEEIRRYITKHGSVCVKVHSDQLNRIKGRKSSVANPIAVAATAALLAVASESSAQIDTVKTEQVANSSVTVAQDEETGEADTTVVVKGKENIPDEPLITSKPVKKRVFLRLRRKEYYVMNKFPFIGSRYRFRGLRGKF